jgi:hypothetical protein
MVRPQSSGAWAAAAGLPASEGLETGCHVFEAKTNAGRLAPIMGALRALAPAAALAFGAMAAPSAQADVYVFQNGSMDHPRTLSISGIGTGIRATPVQFDGYIDDEPDRPFTNLVAFCVDVYHSISLGNYDPDLTYTDTIPLTHDSNPYSPQPLTTAEIVQIGRLVNYGTNVFYNAPVATSTQRTQRWDRLAAVQGAIWQVASGRNVTSSTGSINTLIDNLAGANYTDYFSPAYGPVNRRITFLTPSRDSPYGRKEYPHRKLTQAFAITNAVPEPATWLLMIGGFAIAGGALRRARSLRVLAA